MDTNRIGKFIKERRIEKKLTQQELGDKLFVTDKAVSKWERGLSLPDITILSSLASILDVEVEDILNGEINSKNKIDIEEEIKKALNQIKKKKRKRLIIILIVITSLLIIGITNMFVFYKFYHPNKIKEGSNKYVLGNFGEYNLQDNGLNMIDKLISITPLINNTKNNISSLEIKIDENSNVDNFYISLYIYNLNNEYIGNATYKYTYKNKNLEFIYDDAFKYESRNDYVLNNSLVFNYNKSNSIDYVSTNIKKIPINKIGMNDLFIYKPKYYLDKEECVYDLRNNNKLNLLEKKDYNNCVGGKITKGVYRLYEYGGYKFIFDNLEGDIKQVDFNMETDYYINPRKELLFTRDYGVNYIKSDITSDEVIDTLEFYRDIKLSHSSYYISTNELIPVAFFYSSKPKLKISKNNATEWIEYEFMKDNNTPFYHRVVGFIDQNIGYAAIGSDYSNGNGEIKKAYITLDGGNKFKEMKLPEVGTSHTLIDLIMIDKNTAVLSLNDNSSDYALLYSTTDQGKTWHKVTYIPSDSNIDYLYSLDKINKKDDYYYITMGKGDDSTLKAIFKTKDLINFKLDKTYKDNIHTVG